VKAGQEERKSCFFCVRRNDEKQQINSSITRIETEPLRRAFTIKEEGVGTNDVSPDKLSSDAAA
jgi:hypothetical protein